MPSCEPSDSSRPAASILQLDIYSELYPDVVASGFLVALTLHLKADHPNHTLCDATKPTRSAKRSDVFPPFVLLDTSIFDPIDVLPP